MFLTLNANARCRLTVIDENKMKTNFLYCSSVNELLSPGITMFVCNKVQIYHGSIYSSSPQTQLCSAFDLISLVFFIGLIFALWLINDNVGIDLTLDLG